MRGLRALAWFIPILAIGGLIIPAAALAQSVPDQGISLQISPLPIQLNARPGQTVSADLRVRNAGTQTEKLQVRLLKVTADNNGDVHLTQPKASDEFTNWVHFSKPIFDAPAGEWQDITMTVNVPTTAAYGYYFAVEYLRANSEQAQPGNAQARGAVATFILLNAQAAGASRQAQITSFNADRKSYEFLPATFTVKVKSTGNVHVAPHGNIFITHGGKQIGSIAINAAEGNILPGSSRYFQAQWSDGFPVYVTKYNGQTPVTDKNGNPVRSLKWNFTKANKLRFGHYTAHLVMIYDNGQRDVPMEAYVSFWVIPWRIIGVFIVLLLLIGVGLWSSFRRAGRAIKRQTRRTKSKPAKSDG